MRQNTFAAGAPPRTPLGELTALPLAGFSEGLGMERDGGAANEKGKGEGKEGRGEGNERDGEVPKYFAGTTLLRGTVALIKFKASSKKFLIP